MSRLQFLTVAIALSTALSTAACGEDTIPIPTTITPIRVTDTFTGALNQNGAATYPFATATSGNVQAILTTLSPDAAIIVGLSLGTWNGSSCQIVIAQDKATQSASVLGTASSSGTLCVRIYDVGNVVDPVGYEIQVVHP